jgi:hypothetical protein
MTQPSLSPVSGINSSTPGNIINFFSGQDLIKGQNIL